MDYLKATGKINSAIYSIYNTCAAGVFALRYPFMGKALRKNKKFKDKHKGERCFILGLGPSLKDVDLNLLKDEKVFAVNFFNKFDTEQIVKPDYYFLIDNKFYGVDLHLTKELINKYPDTQFFLNIRAQKKLSKPEKYENCNYLYYRYIQHRDLIKYKAHKSMTAGVNVIPHCIQTALYMGFSEIVLLGCDFNYLATRFVQNHCYDEEDKKDLRGRYLNNKLSDALKSLSAALVHHDALANKAREMGVKIYNTAMESFIMSYEFKKFEDVIGVGATEK